MHDRSPRQDILAAHRAFFASGRTQDVDFRVEQLKVLRRMIAGNEAALFATLAQDLRKPPFEAYGGDIGIVLQEIDHAIRHLRSWARPRKVRTPLAFFPAACSVHPVPRGVALIIGPWNFPVQLLCNPLVGALAAGNCAVLKPSPLAPATTRVLADLVAANFDPAYVSVVEGGADTGQLLLEQPFDHIFFTGSPAAGRLVMAAAAKHLTPVTLELGGKNPCIVDADADLDVAARRIAWGKFFNAGQSCVAVDYLLADQRIKSGLVSRIVRTAREFYGDDPSLSPDYARIVSQAHAERLARLLSCGNIVMGGRSDAAARYVAPTVIDNIIGNEPVMEEEIFGPILPVIGYASLHEAVAFVNQRPNALALYLFTRDRDRQKAVLAATRSGSACVNDTVIQETITGLPFGGSGASGIGNYHGRASFDAFSHFRSIVRRGFRFDLPLRYPPYGDRLRFIRKFF